MTDWLVPLSDIRFTEAEVEAVADVYRRGWLSQGPAVARFEAAIGDYLGCEHTIAVSSGTTALHLACVGIELGPGDEVVLPSLTFAATAAVVVQTGARPVFADIEAPDRPWLSADSVREVLGPRTRAIITVAYAGDPGPVVEVSDLARARGLRLIEDAAHALGASVGGRSAGTIGDLGAFSFFSNKNLPLGEGGLVVVDDGDVARRLRLLRSHGLSADTWARHREAQLEYDVLEPGFNYRLDEPRAELGLRLLGRLDADNRRRGELAARYQAAFRDLGGVRPLPGPRGGTTSAWHIYPVLLDEGVERAALRHSLHAARIQTSVHYPALHLTRAFAPYGRALPATEAYSSRTVTLPLFGHMSDAQQDQVLVAVREALHDARKHRNVC